ncbi:MAG: hypothetical protein KC506_03500 [Nanoarchaeota archaeon]|nr:hypothetical protein [Nanoarchaeota archaeon]
MAVEELLISATDTVNDLAVKLGSLGRWVQALSLVVVLWILIQTINFFFVFKKIKKGFVLDK